MSVGVEEDECTATAKQDHGVGIDLGIKDLAICSDGTTYKNINKCSKVRKLEKRLKRQKRKQSRMMENNIDHYITDAKGYRHPVWKRPLDECKNFIKQKGEVQKTYKRLSNIRQNYLHQTTAEIVNREPKFICIEDLNVKGMMKNKHLSKAVQQQGFREFRRQIEYKAGWHGIPVIVADKWYPSSKTCCCCGHIKKDLKLSDRTYVCPHCGNVIDRDFQAALNLKRYGEAELFKSVS
jgi:putative transposase